jgi:hypothetical protein
MIITIDTYLGGRTTMQGEKITVTNGVLNVPNNPIIPFIEGTVSYLISGLLPREY